MKEGAILVLGILITLALSIPVAIHVIFRLQLDAEKSDPFFPCVAKARAQEAACHKQEEDAVK